MKKPKKFSVAPGAIKRENLATAKVTREACVACGLYKHCDKPFAYPNIENTWSHKLLVVGHIQGAASRLLRQLSAKARFTPSDIRVVAPTRCYSNRKPSMTQLRACRPYLLHLLKRWKPKYVLALGADGFRALSNKSDGNITKNRGKPIMVEGM